MMMLRSTTNRFFPLTFAFILGCPWIESGSNSAFEPSEISPKASLEDVRQDPVIEKAFSKGTKVYLSLTTSPKRLGKAIEVVDSILKQGIFFQKVFIALPAKFRDQQEYGEFPERMKELMAANILEILIEPKDLGPIMKLIPAIRKLQNEPDAVVVTIDDDIRYSAGSLGQLVKYNILYDVVAAATGNDWDYLDPQHKRETNVFRSSLPAIDCPKISGFEDIAIFAGFQGVAYRVRQMLPAKDNAAIDLMIRIVKSSRDCYLSDDLVINSVLSMSGIRKGVVNNRFMTTPSSLPYGFEEDALHRTGEEHEKPETVNIHPIRYGHCLSHINRELAKIAKPSTL